ncbi:MAG: nitroreductase family protein [Planctomycetota bacterium]|jgi:nitroreductase
MDKTADSRFPLHPLLAERWSPLAFDSKPVEAEHLGSLLEAARWAPSCFNEQPWSFLVGTSSDSEGHARLLSCIVEANARWAEKAPVLMLSVASSTFARNGKPNRHAQHDLGLAVENMVIQAQSMGLVVHQMGGFDAKKAREVLNIPDDQEPMAMIAIGYPAAMESLPEDLRDRERSPRSRKALNAIAFGAGWGSELAELG